MSQAHADPEELEKFAAVLAAFVETVEDATGGVASRFDALGDTWDDAKQREFAEAFDTMRRQIADFSKHITAEQIPYLQAKAAQLREYLNQ
jgi:uncharacterized protein YukE